MYADELNPEDLFNMFFGGGGRGGQFGGGQFGNANGMPHCRLRCLMLICSLYVWRRQRFPSYWWRSSSASTSRRSGCQPHRRSTTHHHSIRICPHFPLAVPVVRLHGARSRIYVRANGQVLDGQKYVAAWSQVLCRPARVGGVQYLAIYSRGEEGQEGYGHVQSKDPGL